MIRFTVSFALLLQDDYDGALILGGGHRFLVDGKPVSPVKKPEGYYVFTDDGYPEEITVTVLSSHYSPAEIKVRPGELDRSDPVIRLRLMRSPALSFPGCGRIEGEHKPFAEVFAFWDDVPPLRLGKLWAEEGRTLMTLKGYTSRPLTRRRFGMGAGKKRELFVIVEKRSDGAYLLDRALSEKHSEGESIMRVTGAVCDERGRFAIPVEPGAAARIEKVEYYDKEVNRWGCLCVTAPN